MAITVKCIDCGSEFQAFKCHVERGSIKRCEVCRKKSKKKQVDVYCHLCGKHKTVKQSKYDNNNTKRFYCCREHKEEWIKQSGANRAENNPNYKGGKVEILCCVCGIAKMVHPSRKEAYHEHHCSGCTSEYMKGRHVGENNGKWKGGKVSAVCAYCKKEIKITRSKKENYKNNFCPQPSDCQGKWMSENSKGKNNPNYRGGGWKNCTECGKVKWVVASRMDRERHFHSKKCAAKWYSKNFVGELTPNWQGGKSFEPYPHGWKKALKTEIRSRDGFVCQICGKSQDDNGRLLDVHHIDYNKDNLSEENLISLCRNCHSRTNANRDYWQEYFSHNKAPLKVLSAI